LKNFKRVNKVTLLLGCNIGERLLNLEKAEQEISVLLGKIIQRSSVYETAPWGNTSQGNFLNSVIVIESFYSANEIMTKIIFIEEAMGRVRTKKWEARVIDIDILFFNDEIISTENLTVPHPGLHLRKFTLIPLVELMPSFIHPVFKKTVTELLSDLNDPLEVKKFSTHLC